MASLLKTATRCISNLHLNGGMLRMNPIAFQGLLNFQGVITQSVRTKMIRRPRGGGRPLHPGQIAPDPHKYAFRVIFPEDGKYTTKPLKIINMAGRHPETGHVVVETRGGGIKKMYRWVDYRKHAEPGKPFVEKIQFTRFDPVRSADIAYACSGDKCRWIIASENMKAGDLVTTYVDIPRIPVRPKEGDSHPIGALTPGTSVYNIEPVPGMGGIFCRAAGTSATYIKKAPDGRCILKIPSKREISISEKCMVTVGRVSNIDHGSIPIGSPNRLRHLGFRPRTGLHHQKDGYCGRKVRRPPPVKVFADKLTAKTEPLILSL